MSKSTPINQLPIAIPQLPPPDDRVYNDIEQNIQEVQNPYVQPAYPKYQQQPQYMQQQLPPQQQQYEEEPTRARFVSSGDIKLFVIVLVLYFVLTNEKVINLIASKIPGLSNPIASLVVRGVLVAALVVVTNKLIR